MPSERIRRTYENNERFEDDFVEAASVDLPMASRKRIALMDCSVDAISLRDTSKEYNYVGTYCILWLLRRYFYAMVLLYQP